MPKYEKPTKELMLDFAREMLKPGQVFEKQAAVVWFGSHYPDINPTTVQMHVEGMAVNSTSRKHHRSIKPGSGHDLFYKLGPGRFRLREPDDPAPIYRDQILNDNPTESSRVEEDAERPEETYGGSREFAFEHDLRNYLSRNMGALEPGLQVYQDEDFSGIEFPVGGRFIDILALDAKGDFVVIELKVSRGYDRVVGQILRYMGWVRKNLAGDRRVRGIIVASDITEDLKLAASQIPDVRLVEYEISFRLKSVMEL